MKHELADGLVEHSTYARTSKLKERLIRAGMLANACAVCGISTWQGRPLSLHLDRVNGQRDDNRLTNLRLLCPNCHSQTDTYTGRNIGRYIASRGGVVREFSASYLSG